MIDIQTPEKIKRGEVLRGSAIIQLDKDVKIRDVIVSFENKLSYPNPCKKNLSGWKLFNPQRFFYTGAKVRNVVIPFEFNIPKEVPPTYEGISLSSSWKVKVKVDIPLSFDIHSEKSVEVER